MARPVPLNSQLLGLKRVFVTAREDAPPVIGRVADGRGITCNLRSTGLESLSFRAFALSPQQPLCASAMAAPGMQAHRLPRGQPPCGAEYLINREKLRASACKAFALARMAIAIVERSTDTTRFGPVQRVPGASLSFFPQTVSRKEVTP